MPRLGLIFCIDRLFVCSILLSLPGTSSKILRITYEQLLFFAPCKNFLKKNIKNIKSGKKFQNKVSSTVDTTKEPITVK